MDMPNQTQKSPDEIAERRKRLRRAALEDLIRTKDYNPRFYNRHKVNFFYATLWEKFDDFNDSIKVKHPQLFRIFRYFLDKKEERRNRLPSWMK